MSPSSPKSTNDLEKDTIPEQVESDQPEPVEVGFAQAIHEKLALRKKERRNLEELLGMKNRGGLSVERALALQHVFRKKELPTKPEDIKQDERERMEGRAEMAFARLMLPEPKPKLDPEVELKSLSLSDPPSPTTSPKPESSSAKPTSEVAEEEKEEKEEKEAKEAKEAEEKGKGVEAPRPRRRMGGFADREGWGVPEPDPYLGVFGVYGSFGGYPEEEGYTRAFPK